jgi:hypothetical protein
LTTTIGTASVTLVDAGEKTIGSVTAEQIQAGSVPLDTVPAGAIKVPALHTTQVMLIANTTNWRKVIKDLIGDEPVSYSERSKRDTLRKRPIINISSEDPEALKRIQSKAAEVE